MPHSAFIPSVAWVAPFVGLLLGIALLPLAAPRFWASNARKLVVSVLVGLPVVILYARHAPATLVHAATDYASFMALLGSLFVVAGGVSFTGDLEATPAVNATFLAVGALLASFIGTTGASMLLIQPLLQTNSERRHVAHTVVFFIFLVSNIGGCLTPLGDPPLFLGYLEGVPFTWTWRLLPAWALTTGLVLGVYLVWDRRAYARETAASLRLDHARIVPLAVRGKINLVLLAGIVVAAALLTAPWRELAMLALTAASLMRTPRVLRAANHFSLHPVAEVAAVFAGLFMTMMPALDLLRARGGELVLRQPWQYFWATGTLTSFLDNAPAYMAALAMGQGQGLEPEVVGVPHRVLIAISLGAVFMGANTYLGNGPNFMVRAIAESRGVAMPSFGRYTIYSGAVLLPVFLIVTVVFFLG